MAHTKKTILSSVLGFLILANLAVAVYAVIPMNQAAQKNSTRLGMKLIAEPNTNISSAEIDKAMAVIKSRLAALGVSQAIVEMGQKAGEDIVVLIPAESDNQHIKEVITYSGQLELIPLVRGTEVPYTTREKAEQAAKESKISTFEIIKYSEWYSSQHEEGWVVVEKAPLVSGADFNEAKAIKSQFGVDEYEVEFTLKSEGAGRLSDWTSKNVGEKLAIVLNREVKSAPRIMARIPDHGQISGRFTKQSAAALAIVLTSGVLPHGIELVSEQTIPSK